MPRNGTKSTCGVGVTCEPSKLASRVRIPAGALPEFRFGRTERQPAAGCGSLRSQIKQGLLRKQQSLFNFLKHHYSRNEAWENPAARPREDLQALRAGGAGVRATPGAEQKVRGARARDFQKSPLPHPGRAQDQVLQKMRRVPLGRGNGG